MSEHLPPTNDDGTAPLDAADEAVLDLLGRFEGVTPPPDLEAQTLAAAAARPRPTRSRIGPFVVGALVALGVPAAIAVAFVADRGAPGALEPPPAAGTATGPAAPEAPGAILGAVLYDGPPPGVRHIAVTVDREHCCVDGDVVDESLLVDPATRGLRNAVVLLKRVAGGRAWTAEDRRARTVELQRCAFRPHVRVVPTGTTLRFHNADGILHNLKSTGMTSSWNGLIPAGGEHRIELQRHEEVVELGCGIHRFMSGWVVASDHPYVTVTDQDGRFALAGVPKGRYDLVVWHERLGRRKLPVEVAASGEANVEVSLGPE